MIRLIKRYESRKLYDTEESRYVSLDEIAAWVREGQEVKVVDNATSADVTAQTLTQVILDEGRRGTSFLPSELLHELVRVGEKAVSSGVEQVQHGVDRLVQASVDRLAPVRRAREEMSRLRGQLERLEGSLTRLESDRVKTATPRAGKPTSPPPPPKSSRPKATATKSTAAKSTAAKASAPGAAGKAAAKAAPKPATRPATRPAPKKAPQGGTGSSSKSAAKTAGKASGTKTGKPGSGGGSS